MTISSETRKAGPFTGNGLTATYPFTFKVFANTDLVVVRTDLLNVDTTLALTTDYTVSLNADQDSSPGGSITLVAGPLDVGLKVTMTSDVPLTQGVDITNQGGFYPEIISNALDKLTIISQQLQLGVDRSAKLPISNTTDADTLTADIVLLADNFDKLDLLVADIAAIVGVHDDLASVDVVSANLTNVNTVASNITNVNTVSTNIANVNTVAGIKTDVQTVAANVLDVTNFADVYYGPSTTDPTVRKDGGALQSGDLYFNTSTQKVRAYTGGGWVDAGTPVPVTITIDKFSGTGSQTNFTLSTAPTFTNATSVRIAGVGQRLGIDFTVSGSTLTFTTAPPAGTNNIYVTVVSSYAGGVPNDGSVTAAKMAAGAVVAHLGYTPLNKAGDKLTGALEGATPVTIASASTVAIGAAASNYITISGTTTITAFDTIASGAFRRLRFLGAVTLTHNATSLILPGGKNITTTAGDVAEFVSQGSGNWRCVSYLRNDGTALYPSLGTVTNVSSATSITLTSASTVLQKVSMSAVGQKVILPAATTMPVGSPLFVITNINGYAFDIADASGSRLIICRPGETYIVSSADNSTSNGSWLFSGTAPSIAVGDFSANPLTYTYATKLAFRITALSSTLVVAAFVNSSNADVYICAGTVSSGVITWGTPQLVGAGTYTGVLVVRLTATEGMLFGFSATASNSWGFSVSGTTVTMSPILAAPGNSLNDAVALDSTRVALLYTGGLQIFNYNGTGLAPNKGSAVGTTSGNDYTARMCLIDTDKVAIFVNLQGTSAAINVRVATIAGLVITMGATLSVLAQYSDGAYTNWGGDLESDSYGAMYAYSPTEFALVWNNPIDANTNFAALATTMVFNVSGTTVTFAGKSTFDMPGSSNARKNIASLINMGSGNVVAVLGTMSMLYAVSNVGLLRLKYVPGVGFQQYGRIALTTQNNYHAVDGAAIDSTNFVIAGPTSGGNICKLIN